MKPEWAPKLESEISAILSSEPSGHDPSHAFRVRDLGVRIAVSTGADRDVVEATALLHDVGHKDGREDHASRGATLASEILGISGFPSNKTNAVVDCIAHHHWKPNRAGDPLRPTLEYQAFADADRLDALGAIGIARTFAFGGAHGRLIWNPAADENHEPQYGHSSVHHFYDKLFRLPDDMYTVAGHELALRRVTLMRDFLQSLYAEWNGDDLNFLTEEHQARGVTELPLAATYTGR